MNTDHTVESWPLLSNQPAIKRPCSRRPPRRSHALARPVVMVLAALCALDWMALPASGTTWVWLWDQTQDSFWSNPNNWYEAGVVGLHHGVPQNGDDLYFDDDTIVVGPDHMVNDLTNLVINSMAFSLLSSQPSKYSDRTVDPRDVSGNLEKG